MQTRFLSFILILFLLPALSHAQTDAGIKILHQQGELYDSVKKLKNPYILPMMGKKLGSKGFLLPYPIGVMLNTYIGSQDVSISNLTVGINDASGAQILPPTSLDEVVKFSEVKATIRNFNMRTDLWVLPFLDVYGIFGKAWVETGVSIDQVAQKQVNINTQANFDGYVYGIGGMLTGGIRSIFFSLDVNKVWTHFDELQNNNTAVNVAPRIGYVFHLQNNPEENISVWTGLARVFLNNKTAGSIPLSEIAPDITQGSWYNNLGPVEQKLVDRVIANNQGDVINYSLEKRPTKNWCMILGAQFQLNRHWQFRVESNFLGGRSSGLISANYRFGIFKPN